MHIYGKDQQAFHLTRTRAEKYISRVNTLVIALQLGCFISAMIRLGLQQQSSMSNSFFVTSPLRLMPIYTANTTCVLPVNRDHAFFRDVTYNLSYENIQYFVSRSVINIRYLLAVTGVYTVMSIINRAWFETNTHEIRYHFLVFRKDTVTTWEILLMVMGIVLMLSTTRENQIIEDYLVLCNPEITYLRNRSYNSVLPLVELYALYFVSLGITVLNMMISAWNLSKSNPRDEMIKQEEQRRRDWLDLMRKHQLAAAGEQAEGGATGEKPAVTYAENVVPVAGNSTTPDDTNLLPPLNSNAPPPPPPPPGPQPRAQLKLSQPQQAKATATTASSDRVLPLDDEASDRQPQGSSGRYLLREVQDDEPVNNDSALYSSHPASSGPVPGHQSAKQTPSEPGSLLATRHASIPPPPPVAIPQTRQPPPLPPPSPNTANGDTTDDTVRVP